MNTFVNLQGNRDEPTQSTQRATTQRVDVRNRTLLIERPRHGETYPEHPSWRDSRGTQYLRIRYAIHHNGGSLVQNQGGLDHLIVELGGLTQANVALTQEVAEAIRTEEKRIQQDRQDGQGGSSPTGA